MIPLFRLVHHNALSVLLTFASALSVVSLPALAQHPMPLQLSVPLEDATSFTTTYGPYSGTFIAAGPGLHKTIPPEDTLLQATSTWTLSCWVNSTENARGPLLIAGVGDPSDEDSRYFAILDGKLAFRLGEENELKTSTELTPGQWHFLSATFDGSIVRLYSDGVELTDGKLLYGAASADIQLAPAIPAWPPSQTALDAPRGAHRCRPTLQRPRCRLHPSARNPGCSRGQSSISTAARLRHHQLRRRFKAMASANTSAGWLPRSAGSL